MTIYAIYAPFAFLVKSSILLLYIRIFGGPGGSSFTRVTWVVIIFLLAYHVATFFPPIFNCSPREKRWNPRIEGTCIDMWALGITSTSINILTDIVIFILPIKPVWKLQLPTRQKITLFVLFTTGSLYERYPPPRHLS